MDGRVRAIGLGAIVAALLPGCRWLPLQRPDAGLDPRALSRVEANRPHDPPTIAVRGDAGSSSPLPNLPLEPIDDELLAVGAPTPLLDAAFQRAVAIPTDPAAIAESPPRDPALAPVLSVVPEASETDRLPPGPQAALEAPPPDTLPGPLEVLRPQPEEAWHVGMEALLRLAREQALREIETGRPGHWSAREQLLVRLAESDGTLWQTIVEALTQAEIGAAAEAPAPAPAPAEPAPPAPSLAIAELQLCRRIEGFGVYEPFPAGELRPGRAVGLYWEVEGLRAEESEGGFRTRLESTVELIPASGAGRAWTRPLGPAEDVCRRPRRDFFVNARIDLPADLEPGDYVLRLTVNDALAGTQARRERPVTLAAPPR